MFTKAYNTALAIGDGRRTIIPLATDIQMVKGVGEVTFTRASGQYIRDFENRLQRALDNKAAFPGMRRVENLCTAPNNLTVWNKYSGATVPVADRIVFNGTPGGQVTFNFNVVGTIRFTCEVKSDGTTQAQQALFLGGAQTLFTPTDDWKRVSVIRTLTASAAALFLNVSATPSSFSVRNALIENVTNQSNQNPSEFVNGSAWFDYLNPNSVDANGVVTDSGVRTPITGGKGMLIEPGSTNKCTCKSVPEADRLGSELIVNGGFDTDTSWNKGTSWTISGGVATFSGGGDASIGTSTPPVVAGRYYSYSFTVLNYVNGSVVLRIGGNSLIARTVTANGTYTGIALSDGTGFTIRAQGSSSGFSIDNVSVKEAIDYAGTKAYHDGTVFQNPITGMILSGDTSAVLSIVTDQAAIEAAGLAKHTNGYKFYSATTGAGGAGVVDLTGAFSAVITSFSAHCRVVSGSATLSDNTGANSVAVSGPSFSRAKKENFTAVAGRNLRLTVAASSQVIFGFPQPEELPYCTSEMPTLGATASRAATVASLPVAGNLPSSGLRHIPLEWTPWGSATGTTQCLWSSRLDANNYVAVWANNVIVYAEKRVAGVSEYVTFALTPTLLQAYLIDFFLYADNTMGLFVNGVSAGSGLGNELVVNGNFNTDIANWAANPLSGVVGGGSVSFSSGALRVQNDASGVNYGLGFQAFPTTPFRFYNVSLTRIAQSTAGSTFFYVGTSSIGSAAYNILANQTGVKATFLATSPTTTISLGAVTNQASSWAEWDNISVKEAISTTLAPAIGSTMQFGSFNGAQQCFGQIKNINIGNR